MCRAKLGAVPHVSEHGLSHVPGGELLDDLAGVGEASQFFVEEFFGVVLFAGREQFEKLRLNIAENGRDAIRPARILEGNGERVRRLFGQGPIRHRDRTRYERCDDGD